MCFMPMAEMRATASGFAMMSPEQDQVPDPGGKEDGEAAILDRLPSEMAG